MRNKAKMIVSTLLVLAMVLQISPLSVLTVKAEAKETVYDENGIMYVYYDKVSTYRGDGFDYPEQKGYTFAGWWTTDSVNDNGLVANPTALKSTDTSGSAWAKYVPEDVLTVKAQVSQRVSAVIGKDGKLADNTSLKLRLVTAVDDADLYETIGFKVKVNKEVEYDDTHIYEVISVREKADSSDVGIITPKSAFNNDAAAQFVTFVVGGFNSVERINETELCVTPYWKTKDGTKVYGTARTRLLASDDRLSDADGGTAQSEAVSYQYFQGASDSVYLKGKYTPNGENIKFGITIRNGGQTRQVLFSNAGVWVVNGVDGTSATDSGLVRGTYDTYDDVTNDNGVYVWASKATDGVATNSAIKDMLAGTATKTVIWAIENNVLYCNVSGETVLRLPMEMLCEDWKDGRYYQLGSATYNMETQDKNKVTFEKSDLRFGKNAYVTDKAEGIQAEGEDVATTNAMAYEPINGSYKPATQTGTAYAYGAPTTDAQLLTTTVQLPTVDGVASQNGIYLRSGNVYSTILITGTGSATSIQINGNNNYKISIGDWISRVGIKEYYSDNSCKLTAGIIDEKLFLFINDKLAGSVDLYKLLSHYGSMYFYEEGSYIQLGVATVDSDNGDASFQKYSLLTGEEAEETLDNMLLNENQAVIKEWELFTRENYCTSGTGYNAIVNGYEHTVITDRGATEDKDYCHTYGVPTIMPQKLTATITSTDESAKNGIIVRYSQMDSTSTTNYFYLIDGFESKVIRGYTNFAATTKVFEQAFDEVLYADNTDGSKSYDITAVVINGYIYISYNDKIMAIDQLPNWTENATVRLGLYTKVADGISPSTYENVTFDAGSDVEVPQFMVTSNMDYNESTKVYTPDSSQSGITYAYNTAANASQLMSTIIKLPDNSSNITSSNGLYLKSDGVFATILVDSTGSNIYIETNDNDSYKFSIKNWIKNAGVTEYYQKNMCKLTAGIQNDILYLFINDNLVGSIDLYKILSYYTDLSCYVEGRSTVQLGICAVNPAGGQVSFHDYTLTTGAEAERDLNNMLSTENQSLAKEWEKLTDTNHLKYNTGYKMNVDGYAYTAETNAKEKCHVYGVATSMPQKLSATLSSTDVKSGNGIVVRLGNASKPTYIYGVTPNDLIFYGIKNHFGWNNRATNNILSESLQEDVYQIKGGIYTYDITAIVKDGFINIYYNNSVVFTDYLDEWTQGTVVRLGLFSYTVDSTASSKYTNICFEAGEDVDIDQTSPDDELKHVLQGKKISLLGDSITTYYNISNGNMAAITNDTIANNAYWYDGSELASWKLTYWGRLIEKYNMSLCVNNSASGGMVIKDRDTTGTKVAGIVRCEQLHDNTGADAGTKPDIIAIYLGTNDLLQSVEAGDIAEAYTYINDDGTYGTPETFVQGYAIMLDKVKKLYPKADVFCFTILPTGTASKNGELRDGFNDCIRAIAEDYGATVVDIARDSGITNDNFSLNREGSHPLYQYIYQVSKVFENVLKTKYCGN